MNPLNPQFSYVVYPGIYAGIFLLYTGDMSVEIIPAIIAKNFKELKEKIEKVEPYVKWVQIDIMDGNFVPNITWNKPGELKFYDPGVFLEAHLMISEPEQHVDKWIDAGIKRIVFHIEATADPYSIIKICRDLKIEVGIAINPETPVERLKAAFNLEGCLQSLQSLQADMILILGVTPGFDGQKFKPEVIEKIKALRKLHPNLTIEVDGGMNPDTAKEVINAGANLIVSGSYIFNSDDIKKSINELKNVNLNPS